MPNPPPLFFHKLESRFGSFYLNECANLAERFPDMPSDELEQIALETTRKYFHKKEKELLPVYFSTEEWRRDLV